MSGANSQNERRHFVGLQVRAMILLSCKSYENKTLDTYSYDFTVVLCAIGTQNYLKNNPFSSPVLVQTVQTTLLLSYSWFHWQRNNIRAFHQ